MTMRPDDIKNRTFASSLRGYDKAEVRSFLFKVADSSRELHEKLTAAEEQLASATSSAIVDGSTDALGHDADISAETPATSLAAAEQSIVDRYGALGDRIADLLRSADESATDVRVSAERDAAELRAEAQADAQQMRTDAEDRAAELLSEARAIRQEADNHRDEKMAELASTRLEQESAISEARAAAETEVETYRVDSINEIQALRSAAAQDADVIREAAVADGTAAIAEEAATAARLLEEAENDRLAARAELEEVRSEVSNLLEQARTQSEFIKQEADEIIRAKVRSNYEQAQARIDVLRNTEIASRERIVRAQTELVGALNRLDAEPAPALDPATAPAVIEEAERRHDELYAASDDLHDDAEVIDAEVIDAEVIDAETVDSSEERLGNHDSIGREAFEADIAEAAQQIDDGAEEDSSDALFAPVSADEPQPTGSILAGSFGPPADIDGGDAGPVEERIGDRSGDDHEITEHVVIENDELPLHGEAPSADAAIDGEGVGAASLAEAIPSEADSSEAGGLDEEDALARLVREAMQEAVDSARKHDGA